VHAEGLRDYRPPEAVRADLARRLRAKLAAEETFDEEDRRALMLFGLGSSSFALRSWRTWYFAEDEDWRLRVVHGELFDPSHGVLRADRTPPAAAREGPLLQRMGELYDTFARLAQQQLRGEDLPEMTDALARYGELLRVVCWSFMDDPVIGCAPAVWDGNPAVPGTLHHGCGPMDEIWVRYPWKGNDVTCRGAALSYRRLVLTGWIGDEAWWQSLAGPNPPPRPAWVPTLADREP
jgi:hypothetical protein